MPWPRNPIDGTFYHVVLGLSILIERPTRLLFGQEEEIASRELKKAVIASVIVDARLNSFRGAASGARSRSSSRIR